MKDVQKLFENIDQLSPVDQLQLIGWILVGAVIACIWLYSLRELWIEVTHFFQIKGNNQCFKDRYNGR